MAVKFFFSAKLKLISYNWEFISANPLSLLRVTGAVLYLSECLLSLTIYAVSLHPFVILGNIGNLIAYLFYNVSSIH